MAPFSKETVAASKEWVNAVMEVVGCHDSPCSRVLMMMEDDVFLKHHHTRSVIFIGRLESISICRNIDVLNDALQWVSQTSSPEQSAHAGRIAP